MPGFFQRSSAEPTIGGRGVQSLNLGGRFTGGFVVGFGLGTVVVVVVVAVGFGAVVVVVVVGFGGAV